MLLYGTAWKEDETARLVGLALAAGFRAIDTANQRKHYHEAGVGAALATAYASGLVRRDELFLQTKFTHVDGQDERLPYDPKATITTQVKQSFASSLAHLGTDRLDAYVLHGPSTRSGLAPADREAWIAMDEIHAAGGARSLGVSNVTREQLDVLLRHADVRPAYVQNRCHARTGWDREVRAVCREHGIFYRGFSLLTANRAELAAPSFAALALRRALTPAQLVFRFALDVGMFPLTGTTSPDHIKEDLAAVGQAPLDTATLKAITDVSASTR